MVQWKGDITREESGGKAYRLDQVNEFRVPNFFVVTRSEVENNIQANDSSTVEISEELEEKIRDAYGDIGVSSEVRNASGRAKNLVEGQRQSQRVSVRASGEGRSDYFLDVGSSSIIESFKQVIKSYKQEDDEFPGVIFQKMVEPGHTGSAVENYLGSHTLVEVVKGSGESLERGITKPEVHLLKENRIIESESPEEQIITTRNKMSGQHERKRTGIDDQLVKNSDIKDLQSKLKSEKYSVKFVYKRGSFHVVDAFESPQSSNPFNEVEASLEGLRVSGGKIEGRVGQDITFTDQTISPEKYENTLISRRGGYTSRDAEKARKAGKPAVFSFYGELPEGKNITIDKRSVKVKNGGQTGRNREQSREFGRSPISEESISEQVESVSALEVLGLNSPGGLSIQPPFNRAKYAVAEHDIEAETISGEGYITRYEQFFTNNVDKVVVDTRKMNHDGLKDALKTLEADFKAVIIDRIEPEIIRFVVENGFHAVATERDTEQLRNLVLREEKRFIMRKLREIDSI